MDPDVPGRYYQRRRRLCQPPAQPELYNRHAILLCRGWLFSGGRDWSGDRRDYECGDVFEFGREDPDLFYTDWFDLGAIAREVLDPIGPGGSGQVLPRLWDAESDRAYRAQYVELKPGGVVLLEGPFLIGAGLSFDLTVHLSVSTAALARRTADEDAWTLPAYRRYEQEQDPLETADISVRCDDPEHPALVTRD